MDSSKVVTFRCRFRRYSTYLKSGKRIRFSEGIYRTSDKDVIEHLRKNYHPPMMAEVDEAEAMKPIAKVTEPEAKPVSIVPPFFPGQSDALASLAVPPEAPEKEKKTGSKK